MRAMILAAGHGTRLRPMTETRPKALVPVAGKPMIDHVIEKLLHFGISGIVVNAHAHAEQLEKYVASRRSDVEIRLITETEILGTGGGISNARAYFAGENEFLVHNVDIVSAIDIAALMDSHRDSGCIATLAVNRRHTSRPVYFDRRMRLLGLRGWFDHGGVVRTPEAAEEYGFCGIHVMSSRIFEYMGEGFFDIFRAYRSALDAGEHIAGHDIGDAYWIDLGTREALREYETFLSGTR